MKKFTVFVVLCLFNFNFSFSQESNDAIIEKFFNLYKETPAIAIDYIFGTNEWMERSQDQVDNVKNQIEKIIPLMGEYYGFELITKKSIGKNLILKSYLVKYDRQPLRFNFTLYNPNKKWKILNFSYDDNLDEELVEAAKQNKN